MIQSFQTPQGRYYKTPYGNYPSVTTILDATRSPEDADRLRKWQHKLAKVHGHEQAEQQKNAARDRGTLIHEAIAQKLFGITPIIPDDIAPYWEQVKPVVAAITNPGWCEHSVYHPIHRYAGTLDLICDWQNKPTLIDWKTSHRPKMIKWIESAQLQTAAYTKAYEYIHGLPIKQTLIVVITPQRSQLFLFDRAEVDCHTGKWLERLKQFHDRHQNLGGCS